MSFNFNKKINQILQEADLPKALSDDLKKEHDLKFSGLKPDDLQKHLSEDFGDAQMIGKTLQFVHKKSFYSFIKTLMKNQNKPSIFITVILFLLLVLFYQNILFDMLTVLQLTANVHFDVFAIAETNKIRFIFLGVIFVLSFILLLRLYRGGHISQKIVSSLLFVILCVEIGITASFLNSLSKDNNKITDQQLIENPYAYDEPNEADWVGFYNEKDGYELSLPLSYVVYRKDGTSDLVRYFTPFYAAYAPKPEVGEIVAFGSAFSSDADRIDVKVFDLDNTPDKKADETWADYYFRTELKDKKYKFEAGTTSAFFSEGENTMPFPGLVKIYLDEPIKMRKNIALREFNNRLYAFLYDAENAIHKNILYDGTNIGVHVPEEKINWVTFDVPNCPFTLQVPDYWQEGYIGKNGEHVDIDKCEGLAFVLPQGGGLDFRTQMIKTQDLKASFISQGLKIKVMGDTQWQGLEAKRFLVQQQPLKEEVGFTVQFNDEAGFAIELKPNEWMAFYYAASDKISEKVLNSLRIK